MDVTEGTMDTLIINIESSSKDATPQLDRLINKLAKLQIQLEKVINTSSKFFKLQESISKSGGPKISSLKSMKTPTGVDMTDENAINKYRNERLADVGIFDLSEYKNISKSINTAFDGTQTTIEKFKNSAGDVVTVSEKIKDGFVDISASSKVGSEGVDSFGNILTNFNKKALKTKLLVGGLILSISKSIGKIAGLVSETANYNEAYNLFTITMGSYSKQGLEWVEKFSNSLYLDSTNVMQYMGSFNSLIKGLGVGSDKAYLMSKNMTQLTYDLASFKNLSIESAYEKLISAVSGEIEPLRNVGVALAQNNLQQTAYSLGIKTNINDMNEAQKAQLRYIQILRSSTEWQTDMGRTLIQPANALRVCQQQFTLLGKAIGRIFLPIVMKTLPYVMAMTEILTSLANKLAGLLGFKFPDTDVDASDIASNITDIGTAADNTTDKLNTMLAPFDDLNVVQSQSNKSGKGGLSTGDLGVDLPEYDALANLTNKFSENIEDTKNKLKSIVPIVLTIAGGFAAWKLSKNLLSGLDSIKSISPTSLSLSFSILGATNFFADLDRLKKYVDDILKNGADFTNVTGLLSEFVGSIGDIFTTLGRLKLGGALKVVQGIGEIIVAIADSQKVGVNWNNFQTEITGFTNVAIGIGLLSKNLKIAGVATALQGFITVIDQLVKNWDAIKKGDFSGIDKVTMAIAAVQVLGGLVLAFGKFNKLKKSIDIVNTGENIAEVSTATKSIGSSMSGFTSTLKTLAKDLGLGLVIITEVSAAAILFVGAIWVLGKELEQVGIAWQPVINNGNTIATAIGIGTGLLVGIGTAAALLGVATTSSGGTLPLAIGLGTLLLLELSTATKTFISSISDIGNQINNQLSPELSKVNKNAPTVKQGLTNYTSFLKQFATIIFETTKVNILSGFTTSINTIIGWFTGNPIKKFASDVNKTYTQLLDLNNKIDNANPELELAIDLTTKYLKLIKTLDNITKNNKLSNLSGDLFINMKTAGKSIINGLVSGMQSGISGFNNIINRISNVLTYGKGNQIGYTFGRAIADGVTNGIKSNIKTNIQLLDKSGKSTSASYTIRAYATGGYPTRGDMFFANENGIPEMIGRIGNKTAVANNDQITSALTNAMIEGLAQTNTGNKSQKTIIYIGNRKVYEGYGDYIQEENDRYGTNKIYI